MTSCYHFLTIAIAFLPLLFFDMIESRGFYRCEPCLTKEECDSEPEQVCIYGKVRDICGRIQCAKGPGERCGGPDDILGYCGEGLMCISDRCIGCIYPFFKCYYHEHYKA